MLAQAWSWEGWHDFTGKVEGKIEGKKKKTSATTLKLPYMTCAVPWISEAPFKTFKWPANSSEELWKRYSEQEKFKDETIS